MTPGSGRRPVELEKALRKADGSQDGFVWIGLHEPTRGEFDEVGEELRAAPAGRRGRGQRPPAGQARASTATSLFVVLKTARYVDSEELVEIGEVMLFVGAALRGDGPPRRGQPAARRARGSRAAGAARPRPELGALRDRRRRRRRLRAGHRRRSTIDIEEIEARSSPARAESGRAHLPAQARGARVPARRRAARRPARSGSPRERLGLRIDPRGATYFRDVHDHLLRVVERIEGFDELLTSVLAGQPAQVGDASRTRTCARSPPGSRSSPCRR